MIWFYTSSIDLTYGVKRFRKNDVYQFGSDVLKAFVMDVNCRESLAYNQGGFKQC
jgi:hypothetical protein